MIINQRGVFFIGEKQIIRNIFNFIECFHLIFLLIFQFDLKQLRILLKHNCITPLEISRGPRDRS